METVTFSQREIQMFSRMLLELEGIYTWEFGSELTLRNTNCPYPEFWARYFHSSTCDAFLRQHLAAELHMNAFPVILADEENFVWCAIPTFEEGALQEIYMIGPFLTATIALPPLAKKVSVPGLTSRSVLSYLQEVPVVAITNIFTYAIQLFYLITQKKCSAHDFVMQPSASHLEDTGFTDIPFDDDESSPAPKHDSVDFEQLYLRLIREGNLEYRAYLTQYKQIGRVGTLAPGDPLRQAKNEGIVSCTMTKQAAVEGGMDPETAYTLSDYYIQSFESAKSITDVYMCIGAMQDDFIHRVHTVRLRNAHYSDKVSRCLSYIDFHITEKLSLDSIAEVLGYSAYYLSALFKKETGQTLNSYIKQKRVEYAKESLQYSSLDISTISDMLHFASPSHFGKIFKESTGETPGEYRKRVKSS